MEYFDSIEYPGPIERFFEVVLDLQTKLKRNLVSYYLGRNALQFKLTKTPRDITDNPLQRRIREIEAAILPRMMNQVDLALINTNYALEACLSPQDDALVIKGSESPYVNILVTQAENTENNALQALIEALKTEAVREFILDKYEGAVVPAF